LYCDKETLEKIKEFKFDHLYDEINDTLLQSENYPNIDFYLYWAMPKLIALKHEVIDLKNDAVATDQDVIPMKDLTKL
jgi:hypothetical protein